MGCIAAVQCTDVVM